MGAFAHFGHIYFFFQQVNDQSVESYTHDQVIEALKLAGEIVTLTVKYFKPAAIFLNKNLQPGTYVLELSLITDNYHTTLYVSKYSVIGWVRPCKKLSLVLCGQQRPRSACASAQSDQGLHCPLTESLDATECINGAQMPG